MPVRFEEYEDIHLNNSPLQNVICQVRFQPRLRIANEDPVGFQETVIDRFPHFEVEHPVVVGPLGHAAPKVELQPRLFRFKDKEENYSVTLAPDFFALDSTSYSTWASFSEHLVYTFEAFRSIYKIDFATRIGLRYINILTFQNTGSTNLEELIRIVRDDLVSLMRIPEIVEPYMVKQEIRTKVENDGDFTFRFGLVEDRSDEFVLDFDRYVGGEIEVDDLSERCERYHHCIYNAFRWSIADGKLAVFEPTE